MPAVCDLNTIYNQHYTFSLPRTVLESYLNGNSFDWKKNYTEDEQGRLYCDIERIYAQMMARQPERSAVAVMTAGAPGAGKTTLLRQEIEHRGENLAYTDPDDVCLQNMEETYLRDIQMDSSPSSRRDAYTKWRPGSNAANHLFLANFIRDKVGFYFGTTSTAPAAYRFFDFLKKQGYQIEVLHLTAPDEVRIASIDEVSKSFIHVTAEDMIEKGKLLPQRIQDTFLAYADTIRFYYRGAVDADAKLAAVWIRKGEGKGSLEVVDLDSLQRIRDIHNAACESLGRQELLWEKTVEATL